VKAQLAVSSLSKRYGGVTALSDVSFEAGSGEILGIIGPNGAGKTTLVNIISGAGRPDAGTVALEGTDVTHLAQFRRARLGLARTFQQPRPFLTCSCAENVEIAASVSREDASSLDTPRSRALAVLAFVGLTAQADQRPTELNYAGLKLLDLARAIATRPKVLLLDEVMSGVTESEVARLGDGLTELSRAGACILVVEHVVPVIRRLASRTLVLDEGHTIALGPTEEVLADRKVQEAYLGRKIRNA
jgi:branched-chain amino acid transport system ATP-binding protein